MTFGPLLGEKFSNLSKGDLKKESSKFSYDAMRCSSDDYRFNFSNIHLLNFIHLTLIKYVWKFPYGKSDLSF